MTTCVLILSHGGDPHADVVHAALVREGVRAVRLDTSRVGEEYTVTFRSSDCLYQIKTEEGPIHLDESWTIWNRRIVSPTLSAAWSQTTMDIVEQETRATWDALLEHHPGRVVSRPMAIRRAGNKLNQLTMVRRTEPALSVPDTVVTDDPGEAQLFYERHNGGVCFKLQRGASVERDGRTWFVYTSRVTREHLRRSDALRAAPVLLQQYVEKDVELRITVVGSRVIAVAIHSQDAEPSRVDFRRYDYRKVRHEVIALPLDITEACRKLVAYYGLEFGAFDLIRTPEGKFVFLELNPNGQWLWLDRQANAGIGNALADYLATNPEPRTDQAVASKRVGMES